MPTELAPTEAVSSGAKIENFKRSVYFPKEIDFDYHFFNMLVLAELLNMPHILSEKLDLDTKEMFARSK